MFIDRILISKWNLLQTFKIWQIHIWLGNTYDHAKYEEEEHKAMFAWCINACTRMCWY
jgi:hypothetical protein